MKRSLWAVVAAVAVVLVVFSLEAEADPPCTSGDALDTAIIEGRPHVCDSVGGVYYWLRVPLVLEVSATLDFPQMVVDGASTLTMSIPGVAVGTEVHCLPTFDLTSDVHVLRSWVGSTGVVSIRVHNPGLLVDPPSGVFKCKLDI